MDSQQLQEQTATHLTRLALVRWRHNQRARAPTAAQALWLRESQAGYLAWLQAGGFAQPGDAEGAAPKENSGIAPLFSVPLRDY